VKYECDAVQTLVYVYTVILNAYLFEVTIVDNSVSENFRTTTGWPNTSVKQEKKRGGG